MYYSYKHESVRLTGRWDTRSEQFACTTNPGAYFEFAFMGKYAVMVFDLEQNRYPYPHIYVEVDGGDWVETTLDARLRIMAKREGNHVVRVIYKSSTESNSRWALPLHNAMSFHGYDAFQSGKLPADDRKQIEFVGDSITEGVMADVDYPCRPADDIDMNNRTFQDDVTATYAWRTAERLNMRPVVLGFGAVGMTRAGNGKVPACPISYPYNYEGSPITFPESDVVVINHGANDRTHTAEEYLDGYEKVLKQIRAHSPNALIAAVPAFCGAYLNELRDFIARYNEKNNENIVFIDSANWYVAEPLHPIRWSSISIATCLANALKPYLK